MVSDEKFPELDESGKIIGVITRKEAHESAVLIHGAVRILVVNDNGEVFLSKRSVKKDKHPNCLDYGAGGHPAVNPQTGRLEEGWRRAAIRELKEELGVRPDQYELTRIPGHFLDDNDPTQTERVTFYIARVSRNTKFFLNTEEIDLIGSGWFKISDLLEFVDGRPSNSNPLVNQKFNPMLLIDLKRPQVRRLLEGYLK